MATDGKTFPAQNQEQQPGVEHAMDPKPEYKEYTPAGKLKGKVAVITGGDSGIGRAVARLFSLEGASVCICYIPGREEKDAEDTINMIKDCKTPEAKDPIKIATDVGFAENCKMIIDKTIEHFGKINILVNNAAEQHTVQKFEDIPPEQVERVFRTNIFSHFYLTKYALPHMTEGDNIICTTSINAYKGNASLIDYTSTKGAIVAFVRGMAMHLAERKIRVNGVAPGPIWTPLIPATFPNEKVESFGLEVPMKRAGNPHEVATSYVFLASEDASYFSGQVLHPNGGVVVNA